jgi:predicted Fe-Mo cluster-binding NifX family protein
MLVAAPTSKGGLDDEVHESLVRAETFTLVELEDGKIKSVRVVENPHSNEPYGAGSKVALFLAGLGVNVLITRVDCPKGKMILDTAGVRILKVDGEIKLRRALELVAL